MQGTAKGMVCIGLLLIGCTGTEEPGSSSLELVAGDAGVPHAIDVEDLLERETILWEPTEGNIVEIPYQLYDGEIVVEGDISLGTPEEALEEHLMASQRPRRKGLLNAKSFRKWRNGRIRYNVDDNLHCTVRSYRIIDSSGVCRNIQDAVDAWNRLRHESGLEWQYSPSLNITEASVRFVRDSRNYSRYGRTGHRQKLHLTTLASTDTIMHEMGHAMGLLHEHTRPGRGDFLVVRDEFLEGGANYRADFNAVRDMPGSRPIGRYDENSMMHYGSFDFAATSVNSLYDRTPPLVSRIRLSRWDFSVPNQRFFAYTPDHNPRATAGHVGMDLNDVSVRDVDGDGADDLIINQADGSAWSVRGATGWLPLRSRNGVRIPRAESVEFGAFDTHPGRDTVVISGSRVILYSSDGTISDRSVGREIVNVGAGDVNQDGWTDLIYSQTNSRSAATFTAIHGGREFPGGGESAGANQPLRRSEFRLVETSPRRWHIVSLDSGQLAFCSVGGGNSCSSRALGVTVSSIHELHFLDVDQPKPDWQVDVIAPAGSRTSAPPVGRVPLGAPVIYHDILLQLGSLQAIPMSTTFPTVHLRDAVLGRFTGVGFSLISYGGVAPQCRDRPTPMDVYTLGTHYTTEGRGVLTDRWPGDGCAQDLSAPVPLTVLPDEAVDLEASFAAPSGLRSARIEVRRINPVADLPVLFNTVQFNSEHGDIRHVFSASEPGVWLVRMQLLDNAVVRRDSAEWVITVSGDFCGDGMMQAGEQCDDGLGNSDEAPRTCTLSCTIPGCGDGIVDQHEECDEGGLNSDTLPDRCRSTCLNPWCGDNIVDAGESCDYGATPTTCSPLCITSTCGDGFLDVGEQCDAGPGNSDTAPDQCRVACVLPFCGDGVVDSSENCDPGLQIGCSGCQIIFE